MLYVLLAVAVYVNVLHVLFGQSIFDRTFELRDAFTDQASVNTVPVGVLA